MSRAWRRHLFGCWRYFDSRFFFGFLAPVSCAWAALTWAAAAESPGGSSAAPLVSHGWRLVLFLAYFAHRVTPHSSVSGLKLYPLTLLSWKYRIFLGRPPGSERCSRRGNWVRASLDHSSPSWRMHSLVRDAAVVIYFYLEYTVYLLQILASRSTTSPSTSWETATAPPWRPSPRSSSSPTSPPTWSAGGSTERTPSGTRVRGYSAGCWRWRGRRQKTVEWSWMPPMRWETEKVTSCTYFASCGASSLIGD